MTVGSENLVFLLAGTALGLPAGYIIRLFIENRKSHPERHAPRFRMTWQREARLLLVMAIVGVGAALFISFFADPDPGAGIHDALERSAARSIIEEKTGKTFTDGEIDRMIREFKKREGEAAAERLMREYLGGK